jgi:hypothetical protein
MSQEIAGAALRGTAAGRPFRCHDQRHGGTESSASAIACGRTWPRVVLPELGAAADALWASNRTGVRSNVTATEPSTLGHQDQCKTSGCTSVWLRQRPIWRMIREVRLEQQWEAGATVSGPLLLNSGNSDEREPSKRRRYRRKIAILEEPIQPH